jgi:hypothetical protein
MSAIEAVLVYVIRFVLSPAKVKEIVKGPLHPKRRVKRTTGGEIKKHQ